VIWYYPRVENQIYATRNSAARLLGEGDYRTFLHRHNHPEPDAFLLRGKRLVPLFRIASSDERLPQAKKP
jgi:hypothetical protein